MTTTVVFDEIADGRGQGMPEPRPGVASGAGSAGSARAGTAARTSVAALAGWIAFGLLLLLVGTASAALVASRLEKQYAARSEVLLYLGGRDGGAVERFLATQKIVVGGPTLLLPVAIEFGIPLDTMQRQLRVEVVNASAVLRLDYVSADAAQALAVNRAITGRYLARLREIELAEQTGHVLLTVPYRLDEPVWPKPLQAMSLGAAVGLLVAGFVAALRLALPRQR